MARIRSVHPGLFTDEAFASLPMPARILLIGIWTESDDHGVFEWKPLGLKMRIFPADALTNDDVVGLMEALSKTECIVRFEADGKSYGAVRNFCKWQRPKKPTYRYPLPNKYRTHVGIEGKQSGKVASDEGCMLEDVKGAGKPKSNIESLERVPPSPASEAPSASPPGSLSEVSKPVLKEVLAKPLGLGAAMGSQLPEEWTPDDELCEAVRVDYGLTDDDIRTELTAFHAHHAANGSFSANWRASFQTWCKRWKEHRDKQAPPRVQISNTTPKRPEQFTADEWGNIAGFYYRTGVWQRGAGGEPGQLSCKCPPDILEKHNIDPKTGERKTAPTKVATA